MATRIAAGSAAKTRRWRLSTAGRFAIVDAASGSDGAPRTRKARAILAFLCSQPGQRFPRERIAALLWGDRGDAQARASLRQALLEIRQATADGPALLASDRSHLWVEPSSLEPEALDETSWAHGDTLLFDDLDHVSPEFDEWLTFARAERSRTLATALQAEVKKLLARGKGAAALPLIDCMDRIDPFDEDVLRLALEAEFQAGRPAAMQRRLREMDARLQQELGVCVSSKSRALHDELLRAPASPLPTSHDEEVVAANAPDARRSLRALWPWIAAAVLLIAVAALIMIKPWAAAEPKSLAVLPFEAGGGVDPDLADGLSQELLSQLSRNAGLRVIGRTSAWQYKGKAVDLRTVGRQLGADYLVEGSLRRTGNQMHVTVALVRARDGSAMWSRVYSGSDRQAQPMQAAIGESIIGALGAARPAMAASYRPNGEAYALYLKAKGLFRQRTDVSLENARTLLLEAVRIDPRFAAAWAYLGGTTRLLEQDRFLLDPTRPDGPSMTARQAAERAVTLDPQLADAHAVLGLIAGGHTLEGQAHLRRAVELDPNNPQILYWWGRAQIMAGDYSTAAKTAYRAAALDPLWQRTVDLAATASLTAGDSKSARQYLDRIRTGNPAGAVELESSLAITSGDLSKAVEIALRNKRNPFQDSTYGGAMSLIALGFEREGIWLGRLGPKERAFTSGYGPDRATLLKLARDTADTGEGYNFYVASLWQLRTHGRFADIVALYDARQGMMQELRRPTVANRGIRREYGGIVAQALAKVGRKAEAAQLSRFTDDADRIFLANGQVPSDILVCIAGNQAVAGRREEAIALLQRAFADGFRVYMVNSTIREDSVFESLLGDPRFERLARLSVAHRAKERREVEALGML